MVGENKGDGEFEIRGAGYQGHTLKRGLYFTANLLG
jgi:hypothetical protein